MGNFFELDRLYSLGLHQSLRNYSYSNKKDYIEVLRVPGGWLYTISKSVWRINSGTSERITTTFVPWNEEYLKSADEQDETD